jgi:hypothetical protein
LLLQIRRPAELVAERERLVDDRGLVEREDAAVVDDESSGGAW